MKMNKKSVFNFTKRYLAYIIIVAIVVFYTALSMTGGAKTTDLYLLEKIAIAIILAVSLGMVVGFLGELSLGHAGFMCVGAYLGGKISVLLEPMLGNSLGALLICTIAGGLVAALAGLIIGLPALRLRGDYLAIVTLAFGEIVRSLFMNAPAPLFGGTLGLETPRFDKKYLFIVAFVFVLMTIAVTQNLLHSKHGRAVTSIRDNEIAARAMGIDVTKYKLLIPKCKEIESEVAQSCSTLCNPMECSPPGSSVHGILQARKLEWVAIYFSRGSS